MGRNQRLALLILDPSRQQTGIAHPLAGFLALPLIGELRLHRFPDVGGDDRIMSAVVACAFVCDPADIDRVRQQPVDLPAG